jgi:hypothetical protein
LLLSYKSDISTPCTHAYIHTNTQKHTYIKKAKKVKLFLCSTN